MRSERSRTPHAWGEAELSFDDPAAVACATDALDEYSAKLIAVRDRLGKNRSDVSSTCGRVAALLLDYAGPVARKAAGLATAFEQAAAGSLSRDTAFAAERDFMQTYGIFEDDAVRLFAQSEEGKCKVSDAARSEVADAIAGR